MRSFVWIGLVGLLLSACQVRVEERIEVAEDGSGSISLITMFDEEAEGMMTFGLGMEGLEGTMGGDAPSGFGGLNVTLFILGDLRRSNVGDLELFKIREQ